MTDNLFRYSLKGSTGLYFSLDGAGNVQQSATPWYFYDPKDTQSFQVQYVRNEEDGGVFRQTTLPLSLHGTAGKIARAVFYDFAVTGVITMTVDMQRRDMTADINFYPLYSAEIDLSQSVDGDDDSPVFITAKLVDLGIPALMEANRDTDYPFPCIASTPGIIPIRIKGVTLQSSYQHVPSAETLFINIALSPNLDIVVPNASFYIEGDFGVMTSNSQLSSPAAFSITLGATITQPEYDNYSLQAEQTLSVVFKMRQEVKVTNDASSPGSTVFNVRIIVANILRQTTVNQFIYSHTPIAAGDDEQFIFDVQTAPFTMNSGDRLIVSYTRDSGAGNNQVTIEQFANASSYGISFKSEALIAFQQPETLCYGYRLPQVMSKVVTEMTNGTATFQSTYLNQPTYDVGTCAYQTILVPGASIRGLADAELKVSFDQLRKHLNTYMNGIGLEATVIRSEKMSYFYNAAQVIATITANGPVKKSIANDFCFNNIKVGYASTSMDELNGLQEWNANQEWTNNLKQTGVASKDMDLTSPFNASIFTIEKIRRDFIRPQTTSTQIDNSVFLIEIGPNMIDGAYEVYRGHNVTGGVLYPDGVYNVGLRPKWTIKRNLPWLRSFLPPTWVIEFVNGDRNTDLVANGDVEGQSITVGTGTKFFKPFKLESNATIPENLLTLMAAIPYGKLIIDDNGVLLGGHVLDMAITFANNSSSDIFLLTSADTNLTPLIRG